MIEVPTMCGWVAAWEDEREKLTDPDLVHMVDMVILHSVIEAERDWDALRPTIHDDALYVSGGTDPDRAKDKAQQMEVYRELDRLSPGAIGRFQQEMEHFAVGPDGVAHDGVMYSILKGSQLPFRHLSAPDGTSPDDEFLIAWRMALFIPFKDGLLLAEDTYSGEAWIVKQLSPEMIRARRALGRIWAEA